MSGHRNSHKPQSNSVAVSVGLFALLGLVCLTALLFLTAWLALQKDLPGNFLTAGAYLCCAIPALVCGFVCAKTVRKRKALFGILSALPMLLLLAILCFAFYGKIGAGLGIACVIVVLCSAVGSILAVRKKKKRKY